MANKESKGRQIAIAINVIDNKEGKYSQSDRLAAKLVLAKLVPEYAKLPGNSQSDIIFQIAYTNTHH